MNRLILFVLLIFFSTYSFSQDQKAIVFGEVRDIETKRPIDYVTVFVYELAIATETNDEGAYKLVVPIGKPLRISFSRIGYKETSTTLPALSEGDKRRINVELAGSEAGVEIIVRDSRIKDEGMIREEISELKLLPTTSGNFESVLPHIALGASGGTGGELSSQYNVRGGNYDENLVYVNDFEIFRPQLIRSGQQEGLTFPNIDLIKDLSFSSGGFDAKYGDKLSSVLDIRYKRPDSLAGSASMSLLGASAHLEGSFKVGKEPINKLRYLLGARYKTSKYLLGSLDVKGEYAPNFFDFQGYLTYDFNRDWQIGVIGNYNQSQFDFTPQTRVTALGLIDFALQLFTVFEGQEVDDFTHGMSGVSLTFLPDRTSNPIYLKLLASTYASREREKFDILGFYRLSEIETDLGSDDLGNEVALLGTGTQHTFARNILGVNVSNVEFKGGLELQLHTEEFSQTKSHFLQWGIKYQYEDIDDKLNEWERLDSAGYSLPFDDQNVLVNNVLKTENSLNSNRISAFFQDNYTFINPGKLELRLIGGVRASYWDLNKEYLFSPRFRLMYKPLSIKKDLSFMLAGGLYQQTGFYREMRRIDGSVNTDLQSQKSAQILAGLTYDFHWKGVSEKKFRLISEIYYKKLWDLVSFEVDNVRIRYSGENDAKGYAAGLDLRLNGEFVPGAESWINLSFLRTRETLDNVEHLKINPGDSIATPVNNVARPTDQFMQISIFFQDYLPKNENFKMHLNLTVGTGLPFGLKDNNKTFRNVFRYAPYRRVDIGFSLLLWNEDWKNKKPLHPFRFAKNAWLSLEVFNLLQIANEASNTWIKTIFNNQFAVPNFLTSRRLNLRFRVDF
jgi:hypothetical protein